MKRLATFALLAAALSPNSEVWAKATPLFDAPYMVFDGAPAALALSLGDFNGDGHLDVATANYSDGPDDQSSVSIFLGDGDGTLCTPQAFAAGRATVHLALGDFDEDGTLDVIAFNQLSEDATILRGLGDGSLVELSTLALGAVPTWSSVGDATGDGVLDVVVATKAGIVTMAGDGFGGFALLAASDYVCPRLAVGDLNGDGKLDVVTSRGKNPYRSSVLLGHGDGTFVPGVSLDGGYYGDPVTVSLGDFDGDGALDVASLLPAENEVVALYRGLGDGTFSAPITVAGFNGGEASYAVFGDLTGNGAMDIAIQAGGTHWGVGTVIDTAPTKVDPSPERHEAGPIAVGDFDGDGMGDVAVIFRLGRERGNGVAVFLGNGDGTFGEAPLVLGYYEEIDRITIGDLTADGTPDIVVADGDGELLFYLGRGDGSFEWQRGYFEAYPDHDVMVIGDIDLDGFGDLISTKHPRRNHPEYRVELRKGDGVSSFTSTTEFESPTDTVDLGDQNRDGWPDVFIVPNQIRYGTANGGLSEPVMLMGFGRRSGRADFDHDGVLDDATLSGNSVWVTRGRGSTGCGADWGYGAGLDAKQFAIGDVNGDGALDLAIANAAWQEEGSGFSGFTVLLNRNVQPIPMDIDLEPNHLVAHASHYDRWITAYLEPRGDLDPKDIDVATIRLNGLVAVDPSAPVSIEDHDGDGVPELKVKFDRAEVALSIGNGEIAEIIVTGDIGDEEFAGRDTIKMVRGVILRPEVGEALPPLARFRILHDVSAAESAELIYSPDGGVSWSAAEVIESGKGWIDWRVPSARTERARLALVEGEVGSKKATVLAVSDDFAIRLLIDVPATIAAGVEMSPLWPNPSHSAVSIRFRLPHATAAHLDVFDVQGRKVESLRGGIQNAGWQEVRWDRGQSQIGAGLYFIRLKAAGVTRTQRILLLD